MQLKHWFGFSSEENESVERLIGKELDLLERAFDDADKKKKLISELNVRWKDDETQKRIYTLEMLIAKNPVDEKGLLHIQKKIDEELKRMPDTVLLRLRHEFAEDDLWERLRTEWTTQTRIVGNGITTKSIRSLKTSVEEECRILKIVEKILSCEHTELHAHYTNTIPAPHLFSVLQDLALNKAEYLQNELAKYRNEMHCDDYIELQRIISRIRAKDPTELLQHEFEKLLEMKKENGDFEQFILKNSIVKPLWDMIATDDTIISDALYSIGKDTWNHHINYIEIRTSGTQKMLRGFANAQARLDNEGMTTKLRLILVIYMSPVDTFIQEIQQLQQEEPDLYRRFVVGVDAIWQHHWPDERYNVREHFKKIHETLGLPVTTHVGEYWDKKSLFLWAKEDPEYNQIGDEECVRRVLRNVEQCVDAYDVGVKRLGHANIIGMKIRELLPDSAPATIATLEATKQRIKDKIRDRGIVIETNPTSNRNIAGFKEFANHPATEMIANGIRITVNTDDKTIFRTDMQKELFHLAAGLRLKEEQLESIIAEGKRARFDQRD